jgi:hypothetical protein
MPDNKVLAVSAAQVRTMGLIMDGQGASDENNLKRGRMMMRTVWLADTWPTWPYFVDDPDGRDFGDAREQLRQRDLRAVMDSVKV